MSTNPNTALEDRVKFTLGDMLVQTMALQLEVQRLSAIRPPADEKSPPAQAQD